MLYSDTGKDGKQSRETSPPEVNPKGRGSKVVLSYIFYWRFNAIRLQFIRNNSRRAIGPAYRGPNVAGAAGGTRSFHPRYRRGKGILHPTFRNPSSSLKNLCPFTSLLAVTGPVPRLSTHRFRPRILFLLFFFVSARTPLLPLCFPSCPTLRAFSCPIPPLFPASVSILVPAPIPVSSPFLHLLLYQPPPVFILPRVLLTRSHPLPVSDRYYLWPDPKASVTATAKPWRRRKVGVM